MREAIGKRLGSIVTGAVIAALVSGYCNVSSWQYWVLGFLLGMVIVLAWWVQCKFYPGEL